MRFIRFLLICLTLAITLAALFVAAAFMPVVQTWIVERALARHPGLHASVGSVSAGFFKLHLADLRLQPDGVVLTVPALDASLPLKTALWDRKVLFQSLLAKGWTLDLSRQPAPVEKVPRVALVGLSKGGGGLTTGAPAESTLEQEAGRVFRGLLSGWELPCDTSLEGVDLEGDVLFATSSGKEPTRVHVTIKGGGLAAGHGGDFAFEAAVAAADSGHPPNAVAAHGRLIVAMGTPRTLNRIEFKGNLSSLGGSLPEDLSLSAGVSAADSAREESYTLDLSRGGRPLVTVAASLPRTTRRLEGTWKIDLRDSDLARYYSGRVPPSLATTGEGIFDSDTACTRVHAAGRLNAAVSRWGDLGPALDRLGAVTLDVGFDLAHGAQSLWVDRLSVAVVGTRPIAIAQTLQPFSLDERTGALTAVDPGADWLAGSLQGLPMEWLSGLVDGLAFAGGEATGDFVVKTAAGRFAVRSKVPLVATGVSVQGAGRRLGQGLDISLALIAERTPQGWQVQGAPLTVDFAGRRLATIEVKGSPLAEAGRRFAVAGTWNVDLEVLASQSAILGIGSIPGRSASGDFSAKVGSSVEVKGKINLSGHTPGNTLAASVRAFFDAYGGVSFHVPVTMALGASGSDFSADGTWTKGKAGPRVALELSAVNVALEHLGLVAASLAAAGGVALPASLCGGTGGPPIAAGVRDQHPFWGDWIGRVKFHCYRLRAGADELNEVAGEFEVDRGFIRLERGRGVLAQQSPAVVDRARRPGKMEPPRGLMTVEGAVSFDAAAEFPYSVKATATVDGIDAARLFTPTPAAHEPVVEGRFSVVETLAGNGINLEDLVDRRREDFRLTGKGGIIRLLKTNVLESIPDAESPIPDALANVGSLFGTLLGIKRDPLSTGMKHLSKATEAVLSFTYQIPEIRYDQLTIAANRGTDRTLRLAEVAMSAPNERLAGSGQITYVKGLPLSAQPIGLELRFGARGSIAELLATAGLLSSEKDEQGYIMLREPIHFGGTLEQIDSSQWHDLLVKAATQEPVRGKKGG